MGSIFANQNVLEAVPAQIAKAFQDRPLAASLAAIGGLWAASKVYDISTFTWLHFLRPSSLSRYQSNGPDPSWALITGASDGIGRGFAEELCLRGFNLVLHGRNEMKLTGVKEALLKEWPERKIRIMVVDAGKLGDASELEAKVSELGDIDLRILINNIGGGPGPIWMQFENQSPSRTAQWMDISARFPTEITRCLLPRLTRDKGKPTLIMNIGSAASEVGLPYNAVYSGVKAYNKAWSRGLRAEMAADGHNVEVMCILVGVVANRSNPEETPGFSTPTSRRFAQSCLGVVGCGRSEVWAYWPHALHLGTLLSLPYWVQNWLATSMAREGLAAEQTRAKRQ